MRTRLLYLALSLLLLTGCTDTATSPLVPPEPPTTPETPPDSGACAVTLSGDVTVPTTLTNSAAACDYLLDGYVQISSTLVVEPGVVIRATQDASVSVDGGQILALGTPDARITVEGLNHVAGYWDGIEFFEGRESAFDYVDIKDAGQECGSFCDAGGLVLKNVTVSLANSTVSNSYVDGLHISSDVLLTRFENNRFYGNTFAGIRLGVNDVPMLDAASDYAGGAEPNGTPYVDVSSGEQTAGEPFRWKKLNAPYLIDGYFNVKGGTLVLEPGVAMVFGDAGWMTVQGNGVLQAVGTAAEPITFKGLVEQPGYWEGLTFDESPWEENRLEYVEMRHSGSTEAITNAFGAVSLEYGSSVYLGNSVIADNAKFGITCYNFDNPDTANVLNLGPGNTFSNNASGDIDPECGVSP